MANAAILDSSKTNRKFLLLAVVLGMLGAILVYAALSRDTGSGDGGSAGNTAAVVVAKSDIAARTKITADMVEVRRVGAGTVSELSFNDPSLVVDQVTRYPIVANEQVLSSKIVAAAANRTIAGRSLSYTIPEGKRAIAIPATELSDVGGLVLPGDYVDVIVVYDVEFADRTVDKFLVQTLLQNIEVLAVAQAVVDTVSSEAPGANGQRVRNTDAGPNAEAATVTLAVTPEEAQKLVLAQSNGEVRLSLRAFGDGTQKPIEFLVEPDLLPANLPRPR